MVFLLKNTYSAENFSWPIGSRLSIHRKFKKATLLSTG